jgi:hypothetical protein
MKVFVILEHGIEYTELLAVCTTQEHAKEIVAVLPAPKPIADSLPELGMSFSYDIVEIETHGPPVDYCTTK